MQQPCPPLDNVQHAHYNIRISAVNLRHLKKNWCRAVPTLGKSSFSGRGFQQTVLTVSWMNNNKTSVETRYNYIFHSVSNITCRINIAGFCTVFCASKHIILVYNYKDLFCMNHIQKDLCDQMKNYNCPGVKDQKLCCTNR